MKINWGYGITIAILCYVSFIIFMVYKTTTVEHYLVADNYYEQEVKYQEIIDKTKNAKKRGGHITVRLGKEGVDINLPEKAANGTIKFFRVDNKHKDFTLSIETNDNNKQTIWHENLIPGKWIVKIDWQGENGISYYDEVIWFMPEPGNA